jgi:hypothetical protein
MSKPKTANRDYGYNPNMADGVVDMESRVTTSGMGMAGKVEKHSEFMQPNNQPYDEMEYLYPGSDYPWDNNPAMNPIGPGRGWPGNPTDCKSLWNKLFPKHPTGTGAFIPNAQDNAALKQYVKAGCPVDYIPNFCCPGVKISGPKKVDSEAIAEYSVTGTNSNCYYDWDSTGGRIVGGTFYAPKGPTTVQISVNPFMGDDNSKKCDTISVQITTDGCAGESIGITTTQMNVGESQTLTIIGEVPGKSYTWNIASGGGTMAGNVYTAPASNANCTNNPTIQLKVGSSVCASVTIAITDSTVVGKAGVSDYDPCSKTVDVGVPGKCGAGRGRRRFGCDGVMGAQEWGCFGGSYGEYDCGSPTLDNILAFCGCPGALSYTDERTIAMKAAGCCPAQLL